MVPTLPTSVERSVEVNHMFELPAGAGVMPSISLRAGKGNDLTFPVVLIDTIEPRLRVESKSVNQSFPSGPVAIDSPALTPSALLAIVKMVKVPEVVTRPTFAVGKKFAVNHRA